MRRKVNDSMILSTMEDNIKKAVTQMLVLQLLSEKERYILELAEEIANYSDRVLKVQIPYQAIANLRKLGYVREKSRQAPDGRKRSYFIITKQGREYLAHQKSVFFSYTNAVKLLIDRCTASET